MTDKVEQILKSLLQKHITISVKGKTVKKGQLLIFRPVGCFIRLETLNGIKREHVEIPFPFETFGTNDNFQFDYRLDTLADGDEEVLALLRKQVQVKESKFYDRVLTIAVTHES